VRPARGVPIYDVAGAGSHRAGPRRTLFGRSGDTAYASPPLRMTDRDALLDRQAFRDLLSTSLDEAAARLAAVHPADAAEWLHDGPPEVRHLLFARLPAPAQAEVLQYADELLTSQLVMRLDATSLGALIEELPSDDAADLLDEVDEQTVADALAQVPRDTAAELRDLLAHDPESAGGVMATEFLAVQLGQRVGDVVKELRQEDESEPDIGVYVVDADERPIGFIPDHDLLTTKIHTPVEDVMVEPFLVKVDEDQEEVAQLISKYGLDSVGVVDGDGRLVGVISAEDAAEIIEEEVEEDCARLAGAGAERQQTRLPILVRVRQRMPLMALTVLAGLGSAKLLAVLGAGEGGDGQAAVLRYLPLIIGLAGNVGIQSSTILVRGFATGEVEREREGRVLLGEWCVGALIGLLCGTVTWFVAGHLEAGAPEGLGVAVGTAVAVAVAWAAFLGGAIPLGCRRFGIDPAIVAGPFLIALSDLSGSAIYIVVANQVLRGQG
jgi:magnesium transporter